MSLLVLIGLGLLPSVTWLIFYLQEDKQHPEPIPMVIYAFIVGGLITFLVLVLQLSLRQWFSLIGVQARSPLELLSFSAIEEVLKFTAVWIFISRRNSFNEPIDAMMYMVTAALGFAAVENIASLGQPGPSLITGIAGVAPLELLALRFFGATLLHSLTSAIVGYHWGHGIIKKQILRGIAIGLSIAIALHAVFNYLILKTGPVTWVISFVMFIGFFVMSDFERLKIEEGDAVEV